MAHLKNKTIREFNEKDLADRLKQVRSELFKLRKANGTVVIQKESPIYFKKFKRFGRSKNKIHAHVPSNINVKEGDYVIAAECRPISKSVSFVVVEVRT